jgi:catecholate siderophore receptor
MKHIVLLAVTMTLAPAARAAAQADTGKRVPRPRVLAPVVVRDSVRAAATRSIRGATKTETPLRHIPQAVTVVGRELISDQRMQSIADVARYTPGVVMTQGEGHRDAPTIRGNNTTADFFVDGMRDDAQYFRDLYNVDRIESIRGPNALIFGRGGGGGVFNRVSKDAIWQSVREVSLEAGSHDHKRATLDFGDAVGPAAGRFNAMYQNSGMFRANVRLRRYGLNPTVRALLGEKTILAGGYEYFDDFRTVDRGIPSFRGAPAPVDLSTFFGQPDSSYAKTRVHSGTAVVEHRVTSNLTIRNQSRIAYYDKFYQNVFAGPVDSTGTRVSLSGYNNGTVRQNLFNQTEATARFTTAGIGHTLLVGAELGRQASDNLRNTGYFNGSATTISAAFDRPTVASAVTFQPAPTDANNPVRALTASVYVQDQVRIARRIQLIGGLRAEQFDLRVRNNRDGSTLSRVDHMVSPRGGIVVTPAAQLSFYGSYSRSHLPSSGDQFSSLTPTTQALEPERFTNRELGAKWDATSRLALAGAIYRLDRTNTSARDPNDPSRIVQTGAQRTTGAELSATGSVMDDWQLALAYSAQRARIIAASTNARAGATSPLVPRTLFSAWNKYQRTSGWGAGVGVVHQSRVFAAIDNAVTLPAFTHIDAAIFVKTLLGARPQINVENLFNSRYFSTANGNNNISPGAPRTIKVSLLAWF